MFMQAKEVTDLKREHQRAMKELEALKEKAKIASAVSQPSSTTTQSLRRRESISDIAEAKSDNCSLFPPLPGENRPPAKTPAHVPQNSLNQGISSSNSSTSSFERNSCSLAGIGGAGSADSPRGKPPLSPRGVVHGGFLPQHTSATSQPALGEDSRQCSVPSKSSSSSPGHQLVAENAAASSKGPSAAAAAAATAPHAVATQPFESIAGTQQAIKRDEAIPTLVRPSAKSVTDSSAADGEAVSGRGFRSHKESISSISCLQTIVPLTHELLGALAAFKWLGGNVSDCDNGS